MLGFIFWQTANQIFKIKEAHWVYPLLVAALIFRPLIFDKPTYHLLKDASIQESLMNTSYVAIVSAIMISILFWFLSNYIVQKNIINDETTVRNKESSLFQSLKIVLTSKYIWLLCGLISCYSITTGIIELITKNQARILYPKAQDYLIFMSTVYIYSIKIKMIAIPIAVAVLCLTSWRFKSFLAPFITLIIGGSVLITQFFPSLSPRNVILIALSSKSVLLILFVTVKEMAYIPLAPVFKSKGRIANSIGGRFGNLHMSIVLFLCPAVSFSSKVFVTYAMIMLLGAIVLWFVLAHVLANNFERKARVCHESTATS